MRKLHDGIHYESFAEVAAAMNIKPASMVTKDKEKLKSQQEKFLSHHKCRGCGQPLSFIGGNVMACLNEKCKGVKFTREDPDTKEKRVWYETSYDVLDDFGANIAQNIFSVE